MAANSQVAMLARSRNLLLPMNLPGAYVMVSSLTRLKKEV